MSNNLWPHEYGIEQASDWAREQGFVVVPEHWFTIFDRWGCVHRVRADVAGFSDEGVPLLVIEVGGVGSPWHFALAQDLSAFHLPITYFEYVSALEYPSTLARRRMRERRPNMPPHPFGFCAECCLTIPREFYTLDAQVNE